ncbi:helix-turn-helix domain-containing protein [Paludisphaera rhizosphaerae]|uniref:helix-turn-helix domain-containing protein n=1 Tax=Paludisphaera rhizosphaerae TaxID=2711216 RepID=UPI0013EDFD1B|nr:XRE family transcriptional regulator [Paludisphaera rhizosphaerae]
MAIRARDFIDGLTPQVQEQVRRRADEMKAEEHDLQRLREARRRSQEEVAARLKVKPSAVSKIEHRTDVYISTLRKYVEAMGGELEIVARFPDKVIPIDQFSDF